MSEEYRVLHLVRSLEVGGLETVVASLIEGQREHGIRPFLGCLGVAGERSKGLPVEGQWVGNLPVSSRFAAMRGLATFVREQEIDLIHSHNPQPHFFGAACSLLTRVPLVHTKHGRNYPEKRGWLMWSRALSEVARRVVAVSEDAAAVATDIEHVPDAKVIVIRNGIGAGPMSVRDEGGSLRGRLGVAQDAFVVGSVGRLGLEKNYGLLLDAFARLAKRGRDARLVIVGDGPERQRLKDAADDLGIGDMVTWPGMSDDVDSWLNTMDVFCLPSCTEGTSITLLEAGACMLAVVATSVGGNGEVLAGGDAGLLVGSGDAEAMSFAFEKLMDDRELRDRLGMALRARVEKLYSVDTMVSEYMKVYREALRK